MKALKQAVIANMVCREPFAPDFTKAGLLESLLDSAQVRSAPDGHDIPLCQMYIDAADSFFVSGFEDAFLGQSIVPRKEGKNTDDDGYRNELAEQLIDEPSREQLCRFVSEQLIEVHLFLQETDVVLGKQLNEVVHPYIVIDPTGFVGQAFFLVLKRHHLADLTHDYEDVVELFCDTTLFFGESSLFLRRKFAHAFKENFIAGQRPDELLKRSKILCFSKMNRCDEDNPPLGFGMFVEYYGSFDVPAGITNSLYADKVDCPSE